MPTVVTLVGRRGMCVATDDRHWSLPWTWNNLDILYDINPNRALSGHDENYVRDKTIFSLHHDADCQFVLS